MVVSPWSSTVDPTSTTPALRKLQGHQDHDSDAPPLDINVFSSGALFVVALLVVAYFGQVRTARNSHSHLVTQKLLTFVE